MKSKIVLLVMVLFVVFGLNAQQAVIRDLTGTVELRQPGSAEWESAVRGQAVMPDTVISTGFKSTALIGIGNSVLTVRPLTRLTVKEIRASAGTEAIHIGLQAGRVRADVNPPAGGRANAAISGPTATASTRGTVFEVDVCTLWVTEGSVEYSGTAGAAVIVDAGGYSYVDQGSGRVAYPEVTLLGSLDPELPIGSDIFYSFEGGTAKAISLDVDTLVDYE